MWQKVILLNKKTSKLPPFMNELFSICMASPNPPSFTAADVSFDASSTQWGCY